jgi:type IV secretory pathway VirB4 component
MAQAKSQLKKPKPGVPTQRYLDIAEIREDAVVLKDGSLRGVILVSSINFALKSRDEQEAMIQAYVQFLNGIDYPLQVVIQSRRMNIDKYLNSMRDQEKEIKNELLKTQIRDYVNFVKELVDLGDIMQKRFYIVVPYDPATDKSRGFWSKVKIALSPASLVKLSEKKFQERLYQLKQRISLLQGGLNGMGLESIPLDTQGLIELYYNTYNPDVYDVQKMTDVNELQLEEGF